jgi:hypothetical protein
MNQTKSSARTVLQKAALLAFGLVIAAVPTLKASDLATLQPMADAKVPLPLTSVIEKVTGAEKGPYVLKLKNESKAEVKVTAKILLAVFEHGEDKAKHLPAHTIEAGKTWKIADLAAEDKVIVTADGFAPLEIVIK